MRVVDQLVYDKYLVVGDYQVLKMGDISRLKNPGASVMVKITDEDKRPEKAPKVNKKTAEKSSLTSSGYKLFEKLRELRLEIAREENMPPYIVFNDKTLIDMSAKVPASKEEMLEVSGVGENKFKKYGDKFLKAIAGRNGLYEIRIEQGNSIYRVFCCFDEGNLVILFNGFQKKTQKTPEKEINKAIQLKKEYYAEKK